MMRSIHLLRSSLVAMETDLIFLAVAVFLSCYDIFFYITPSKNLKQFQNVNLAVDLIFVSLALSSK